MRVSKILLTAGDPNGRFIMQRITLLTVDSENTGRRFRRSYERMADTLNPGITGQWAWVRTDVVRPLADATYVTLGDSITQGGGGFEWQPLVAGLTGASRVVNGGFGGATMATHPTGPNFTEMSSYKVAGAILNDDWTAVVAAADAQDGGMGSARTDHALALQALDWSTVTHVSVFYGTNDFSNDVPLGAPTDTTCATFYGALNRTIIDMLTGRPQIRLIFFTPIWRSDGETANGQGLVLKDYTDAILNRADAYNIPVADLTRTGGINAINEGTFLSDGTHPRNTVGNDHMAGLVSAALLRHYG